MKALGQLTATIILITISTIVSAFVMMKLWNWLLVKIFEIDPINMVQAIALGLVLGLAKYKYEKSTNPEFKDVLKEMLTKLMTAIFVYSIVLIFGWILHYYL